MPNISSGLSAEFLNNAKRFAVRITYRTGQVALRHHGKVSTEWKGDGTPVTSADLLCERMMISAIRKAYPKHRILGEETGLHDGSLTNFHWIIDGISGTKIYGRGKYPFGNRLTLWHHDNPIVGVFRFFTQEEAKLCWTIAGQGSFIGRKKVTLPPYDPTLPLGQSGSLAESFAGLIQGKSRGITQPRIGISHSNPGDLGDLGAGALFVREAGGVTLARNTAGEWTERLTEKPLSEVTALTKTIPFAAAHPDYIRALTKELEQDIRG